jgi:alpha-tubulin suppressor-like RCC1 family protein/tRNA A-37 threonylcarbamoyl transferase component Bud32
MEKFDVLNELNEEFKQRVKILYVFEDYEYIENMNKYVLRGYNVLMVTKDDKTYAFGNNTYNQLGFGHNRVVKEIQIVNELCDQQIIDFANDLHLCIARNSFGKIYCWGFNRLGFLGIGSENNIYQRPILNHYLNNEFIIDISCGDHYSLALTNFGEVYAWGWNKFGQIGNGCNVNQLIPIKLKSFNNERVVMISSGSCHSMALTECGHVYSWGNNKYGQLGIGNTLNSNEPKFVAVIDENKCNVSIKKISCGISHSFLLSRDGYIYWFGSNPFRELGNQKDENDLTPCKIKTETQFINISSHWTFNNEISLVLSQKGDLFYFFECKERTTRKLKSIKLESFVEFYAKYLNITHKAFNFEEQNSISIILRNKYVNEFTEQSLISFKNFSVISKVMHKSSKRNYVIKRIAINKEESNKAFKELNLMRKLKSIYIFEYIDSWIEENFIEKTYGLNILHPIFDPRNKLLLHIQMELCCETLDEVMKQLSNELMENNSEMIKTLYYYICCELFTEIIECIHYLHERNIIHRDLKPSNIMITDGINGRFIKLSDFGLSVVHDFYKQSIPQNLKSSKYMAPELSQNKKYDLKVDIYSLGIIANELFFFNSNL